MKKIIFRAVFLIFVPVIFYSCSETSSLEEGQYLYAGAKIKIKADPRLSRKTTKSLKPELEGLLRPKPNGSFLGIKVKLLLYNFAGKPTGKGLRYLSGKNWESLRLSLLTASWKKTGRYFKTGWRTADFLRIPLSWIRYIREEN